MTGPVWLTEGDIADLVTLSDAIASLRDHYSAQARGGARSLPKALDAWNGGSLHALGALGLDEGLAAFKTWINTPAGAASVLQLFDARTGALLAVMQAGLLGALRTNGVCGIATDALSAPDADELALIGSGRQAALQIAAIGSVRALKRIRIYSPSAERRSAFVQRARASFPYEVIEAHDLASAVRGAPIVSLLTRAKEPFLTTDMLSPGTHVNAAGAILPSNSEMDPAVLAHADLLVVDDRAAAARDSREFRESAALGGPSVEEALLLSEVLGGKGGPWSPSRVSIFKPLGVGLSDLAIAAVAWRQVQATGVGHSLPQSPMKPPRWTLLEAGRVAKESS